MEYSFQTYILLPIGLGLLGFVEPCTVGGHLVTVWVNEFDFHRGGQIILQDFIRMTYDRHAVNFAACLDIAT